MPDLQQYTIDILSNLTAGVLQFRVSCCVTDHGKVLTDCTGNNAVKYPQDILTSLTVAERDDFVKMIAAWIVRHRVGWA